jgi:DNA-binding response OmpR family regulator
LENPVQQLGFRVHAVGTEAQALEALSQGGVAAVVVTGPASVPFLRALRCATSAPILALDSQADDNRVLEAYDSGVDQFVARPISAQEVVARLTALLRRSR